MIRSNKMFSGIGLYDDEYIPVINIKSLVVPSYGRSWMQKNKIYISDDNVVGMVLITTGAGAATTVNASLMGSKFLF